jgi:NAD(P)-dependent dehydrogenase (short-subunit alcohol dehydrogenase family)
LTGSTRSTFAGSSSSPRVGEITALGRPPNPDEIGPVVAALLSDDMRWINGERIEASGGMKL